MVAGISYSFFEIEATHRDFSMDDWVFGGQVFADINWKFHRLWFLGINGKYQFTEDLEFEVRDQNIETKTSADNWRVGAHVGLMF